MKEARGKEYGCIVALTPRIGGRTSRRRYRSPQNRATTGRFHVFKGTGPRSGFHKNRKRYPSCPYGVPRSSSGASCASALNDSLVSSIPTSDPGIRPARKRSDLRSVPCRSLRKAPPPLPYAHRSRQKGKRYVRRAPIVPYELADATVLPLQLSNSPSGPLCSGAHASLSVLAPTDA